MNILDCIFPEEINCSKLAWPYATLYSCITMYALPFATLPSKWAWIAGVSVLSNKSEIGN